MPSGRKDIYGTPSKRLADPKVIKAEMGAAKNAAIPSRQRNSPREIEALLRREGPTNAGGGRAVKMPAKAAPPKPVQMIRTTVNMKSTPMGKKR
jgi:hypothetical protein